MCILKHCDDKEKLFAQDVNGLEFLIFQKKLEDQIYNPQYVVEQWHGRKVNLNYSELFLINILLDLIMLYYYNTVKEYQSK